MARVRSARRPARPPAGTAWRCWRGRTPNAGGRRSRSPGRRSPRSWRRTARAPSAGSNQDSSAWSSAGGRAGPSSRATWMTSRSDACWPTRSAKERYHGRHSGRALAPDDDLGEVVVAGVVDHGLDGVAAGQGFRLGAHLLRQLQAPEDALALAARTGAAARASRRRSRATAHPAGWRCGRRCGRCGRRPSPGPTQASSDSRVCHTGETDWSRRYSSIWLSTRSAVRRSASSRSAIRLPLRKKFWIARSACWGR